MKKVFIYIIAGMVSLSSCKKDDEETAAVVIPIETQNSYDDLAAQKFMLDNYFDAQGKITEFSSTDTTDDNYPTLLSYGPTVLPSGVIIIKRPSAQPVTGKNIENEDVLTLASTSYSYIAKKSDAITAFGAKLTFKNTLDFSGVPDVDPAYFYTKLTKLNGRARSFYEIEGFQEGIKYFKSCEISSSQNYNLQGAIIVPSRAAFGRDSNIYTATSGSSYYDRSFIFNIQVYKTQTRTLTEI